MRRWFDRFDHWLHNDCPQWMDWVLYISLGLFMTAFFIGFVTLIRTLVQ